MTSKFTLGAGTVIFVLACVSIHSVSAQVTTNRAALAQASVLYRQQENASYLRAVQLAGQHHWPLTLTGKHGKYGVLTGINPMGLPIYKVVLNLTSAQTVGTTALWPGGSTGLNLSGNSPNMKGKIAIWDGGAVRGTHVELAGRVVQRDGATTLDDHATHVSGTLIATGVNPNAKGMAFQAQELEAYDFNNDISEMTEASPDLYVSNHSYGTIAGWYLNGTTWDWYGLYTEGDTVDYNLGFYDSGAQGYDSIAYNAPYYQIVFAAGNERGETGPSIDSPYYAFNSSDNLILVPGGRKSTISSNAYFKTIPDYGNAKDILTVGAVNPIPTGYHSPSDVVISYFSSWGPTTDGRIKPDVVADGVGVFSSISTSDYAYDTYDGTSMATPNTTGSLFLLQEYYTKEHHDSAMRAATLKALAIHTADQTGTSPGPNYICGWGLLDVKKAAGVITSSITDATQQILEKTLVNGTEDTLSIPVVASGTGPLLATIVWTDPPASVNTLPANRFSTTPKLINDLDLRVVKGNSTYTPWILNPNSPASAATKGDNDLDNVEKVEIDSVVPGDTYTIRVSHKSSLARGQQAFSLIISGVGGNAYCTSAPSSSSGTKIDSVSISNIKNGNVTGCTTYSDFSNQIVSLQGNQTVPIYVSLGSCDGSSAARVVKVYIDYNNNGTFTDPGELVATSAVLPNAVTSVFSGSFTTPATLEVGTITRMRIVAEETTDTASVVPCGTYGKGETQDYSSKFATPAADLSISTLEDPLSPTCADSTQIVVVSVRNNGTAYQKNFPVTATVLIGGTTIATLSGIYPDTLAPGSSADYTLPGSFTSVPGTTYTINTSVNLSGDQNTANNSMTNSVTISAAQPAATGGTAVLCGATTVDLTVTSPDSADTYLWYTAPTGGSPIATGVTATTTVVPSGNTFYIGSGGSMTIGPATKSTLGTNGGYNAFFANFVSYTAAVPLTLVSARLYTRYPGPITFIVADVDQSTISASTGEYEYLPYTTTTVNVFATSPNPEAPIYTSENPNDPADTGAVFYLNIPLPAGSHQIIIESLDSATIFRNDSVASNPYPLGSSSFFAWTGNSAGETATSLGTLYEKYYYFFYDAKIVPADCASGGTRTPVTLTSVPAVTITQYGDSLISTALTGNQWFLDGLAVSGATGSVYQPVKEGVYYTAATDTTTGCTQNSNAIDYVLTAVDSVSNPHGLIVSPNPTTGVLNISFTTSNTADLSMEVFDILGQQLYKQVYPSYIGAFSGTLNLSGYADGVYLLKITHGTSVTVKKILLQH